MWKWTFLFSPEYVKSAENVRCFVWYGIFVNYSYFFATWNSGIRNMKRNWRTSASAFSIAFIHSCVCACYMHVQSYDCIWIYDRKLIFPCTRLIAQRNIRIRLASQQRAERGHRLHVRQLEMRREAERRRGGAFKWLTVVWSDGCVGGGGGAEDLAGDARHKRTGSTVNGSVHMFVTWILVCFRFGMLSSLMPAKRDSYAYNFVWTWTFVRV